MKNKKVIFNSEESGIGEKLKSLKSTGFIEKARRGEYGVVYQYKHLVLQELFTAIHIFLSNEFCFSTGC